MSHQNLPHNFLKQGAGLCGLFVPCRCIFRCSESKLFSIADFLTWRADSYKTMHFKYTCTERKQGVFSFWKWMDNIDTKIPLMYTLILFFQKRFCISPDAQWLERMRKCIPLRTKTNLSIAWERLMLLPLGFLSAVFYISMADKWTISSWKINSNE